MSQLAPNRCRNKAHVRDLYFNYFRTVGISQTPVVKEMEKPMTDEVRCLPESELQKLQSFCLQGRAAYGSMLNLVIARNYQ